MTTLLRSSELSCPSCVAKIKNHLNAVDGVQEAEVQFNTGKIEVSHDPERATQDQLVKAVREAGYESRVAQF